MFFGDNNVVTCDCIVTWDGITRPETKTNDETKEQFTQWSISVAIPTNAPELVELEQILNHELNTGMFKGQMPAGGHWGIKNIEPGAFDGKLVGYKIIKAVSYQPKQVFDLNRNELQPAAYADKLYPGATVKLIVSARSYKNKSKGVGFWLGGIQITDTTTPRLPVGGVDAQAAFGGAPTAGAAGAFAPPGQPAPFVAPTAPVSPSVPGAVGGMVPNSTGYAPPVAAGMPAAVAPTVTPNPGFLAPPVAPAPGMVPPPVPPAAPQRIMTAKAAGAPYESFVAGGWTDEMLIQHGYMVMG